MRVTNIIGLGLGLIAGVSAVDNDLGQISTTLSDFTVQNQASDALATIKTENSEPLSDLFNTMETQMRSENLTWLDELSSKLNETPLEVEPVNALLMLILAITFDDHLLHSLPDEANPDYQDLPSESIQAMASSAVAPYTERLNHGQETIMWIRNFHMGVLANVRTKLQAMHSPIVAWALRQVKTYRQRENSPAMSRALHLDRATHVVMLVTALKTGSNRVKQLVTIGKPVEVEPAWVVDARAQTCPESVHGQEEEPAANNNFLAPIENQDNNH